MKKFTLVYDSFGTIHSDLEMPLYLEYFNIEKYDPSVKYDPKTTLFYCMILTQSDVYYKFLQQGYRIVYDFLHEPGDVFTPKQGYVMSCQNYMWYHDSLQMINQGYHKYQPNKTYKKLALMAMHLQKQHRTMILEKTVAYLDDFYWSYVAFGRQLPNDVAWDWSAQRYFNPEWYDDTYFSIVVETRVERKPKEKLLLSEKTFKPIAFQHPFLIWGEAESLTRLKMLGFETFENLFDESYDSVLDNQQRLNQLFSNIGTFNKAPYDKITMEKLKHNRERFFDRALIEDRIQKEIIEPLLEYVETSQ